MENIYIGDDGTLDTVVVIWKNQRWTEHRFDSEYRFSFNNDDEFLREAHEQLIDDEEI